MYAGPSDAEPKALVDELIRDTGFEPTYLGPIRYARNLEVCSCDLCRMNRHTACLLLLARPTCAVFCAVAQ